MSEPELIITHAEALKRRMSSLPPADPAVIESGRMAAEQANRERHLARIHEHWNAPKRHLLTTPHPQYADWNRAFSGIVGKLGSGFTVALVGTRGNGKTQLGVELMKHAAEKRLQSSRFLTAVEFFMATKATYGRQDLSESDVLGLYCKPALLVIDEIGRRADTPWENNLLFELLNRRYNDLKDTVLIANLTPAAFAASVGPSIVRRMNESGGVVECYWPEIATTLNLDRKR